MACWALHPEAIYDLWWLAELESAKAASRRVHGDTPVAKARKEVDVLSK